MSSNFRAGNSVHGEMNGKGVRVGVVCGRFNDLITNRPSPMTYEAEGIPQDVVAEDAAIAVYRLSVNRAASKIVDVEEMFR